MSTREELRTQAVRAKLLAFVGRLVGRPLERKEMLEWQSRVGELEDAVVAEVEANDPDGG